MECAFRSYINVSALETDVLSFLWETFDINMQSTVLSFQDFFWLNELSLPHGVEHWLKLEAFTFPCRNCVLYVLIVSAFYCGSLWKSFFLSIVSVFDCVNRFCLWWAHCHVFCRCMRHSTWSVFLYFILVYFGASIAIFHEQFLFNSYNLLTSWLDFYFWLCSFFWFLLHSIPGRCWQWAWSPLAEKESWSSSTVE